MDTMKTSASLFLVFSLAACGGESISDHDPQITPGSGGGTAGGAPGSSGSGGSAGTASAGAPGGGGSAGNGGGSAGSDPGECVPQDAVMWPPLDAQCEHLWVLGVSNPKLIDQSGDGVVSPGESVQIHVDLNEIGGLGFNMYPGVEFTSDHPGVSVSHNDWYYAIFACQTHPTSATAVISSDVPAGTQVTVTARAAMLNEVCPDAHSIKITLTIQ
jgi:hypothetical protein